MRERNYLQAYDVYMRVSIGNAPWPIGVTSVGIHERSAREKISFSCNGQAHIMNDEATRKYLQVRGRSDLRRGGGCQKRWLEQLLLLAMVEALA
jgi:hypothetical protein